MKSTLPKRLRRAESFLGVHFDTHAGPDCKEVGKTVTPRMIERIIELVRPDYIQCDNKGHPGISSYPTKIGTPAPGFVRDQLRTWRKVTARQGVALFMHHSGVWDNEVCRRHPSWARVNPDGKREKNGTSVFSPYVDKILIPQLKELADDYGVDGVWMDGECWAHGLDYSLRAVAAFREATGIKSVPRQPGDPHFWEFCQFMRAAFRRYFRRYVDAIHAHRPEFQMAGNWAFSSFMPEPVSVGVDFLSGDYTNMDSVNSARLEGRALQHQGLPWDLMAWAFGGNQSTKTIPQLQREAAVVLALGGGFQAYFKQNRDMSVQEWQMNLMAAVAQFCRARQQWCHRAQPVPQVGLILSTLGNYRAGGKSLFNPWSGQLVPLQGTLNALLEAQQSVEILMTHHLAAGAKKYPLLVLPDWEHIEPQLRATLRDYVRDGGKLLIVGPRAARHFARELRVTLRGKPEKTTRWLAHHDWLGVIETITQSVRIGRGACVTGRVYHVNDFRAAHEPVASIARYGRGRIAAVYADLGTVYRAWPVPVIRDFLGARARELFPRPLVEVTGSHLVDVSVNWQRGQLAINLVNTAGPHADKQVAVHDEIPPVGPLTIRIRYRRRPRRVTLQPTGKKLAFRYRAGHIAIQLPRLAIHNIIVVENES